MNELEDSIRRVVHGLLDLRVALDPDLESENAVRIVLSDLLGIPGVLETVVTPSGKEASDLTVLLGATGTLIAQLLARLSTATGKDVEVLVTELREWADSTIPGSTPGE